MEKQSIFRNSLVVNGETLAHGEFSDKFEEVFAGGNKYREIINETASLQKVNSNINLTTIDLMDIGEDLDITSSSSSAVLNNNNNYTVKAHFNLYANDGTAFILSTDIFIDLNSAEGIYSATANLVSGAITVGPPTTLPPESITYFSQIANSNLLLLKQFQDSGYDFTIAFILFLEPSTNKLLLKAQLDPSVGNAITGELRQTYIVEAIPVIQGNIGSSSS